MAVDRRFVVQRGGVGGHAARNHSVFGVVVEDRIAPGHFQIYFDQMQERRAIVQSVGKRAVLH